MQALARRLALEAPKKDSVARCVRVTFSPQLELAVECNEIGEPIPVEQTTGLNFSISLILSSPLRDSNITLQH
jgi:hypothetical protein